MIRPLRLPQVFAMVLAASTVSGAQERVIVVDLAAPVTALRQTSEAVFVHAGGWRQVRLCAHGGICTSPATPATTSSAPDGIPHGTIATAQGRGIVRAWYTAPTTRYGHGVLGDRVEGGALAVIDNFGRRHDFVLPDHQVFEDLTPRIADLDGDGANEVVAIRSDVRAGAAIAVYGLEFGLLTERAAIPPIGLSHRWLNVAGIADYSGDGRPAIAIVKTPHIGGRYELWTLASDRLRRLASGQGFSNHAIGSTELGLSATADVDGDGIVDLAVPDASRGALRVLASPGGALTEIARIDLPARLDTAIGVLLDGGRAVFIAGLADGRLAVIRP